MVICRWYGNFYFFIIVIANFNWVEFSNYFDAYGGDFVNNRFDFECRIFKIKFDEMMVDFKKGEFFFKLDVGKDFIIFIMLFIYKRMLFNYF